MLQWLGPDPVVRNPAIRETVNPNTVGDVQIPEGAFLSIPIGPRVTDSSDFWRYIARQNHICVSVLELYRYQQLTVLE